MLDPRNLLTAYAWDGLDDQLQLASPDTGATNRTFDAAGNVIRLTDARGNTTTYSYDALNRRTHALFADGTSTVWKYDQGANGIGRLRKITDVTGSTVYYYDANGHVTQKFQTAGAVTLTMTYGYDTGGRLASVTYPSGRKVVYAYDAAGRVSSSVTGSGGKLVAGVTYLPFGMAAGWTEGNGGSYQRTIDLDGRITGLALPAADNIALSYVAASRITGRTETGFPAESFTYNTLDRLHVYASGTATQTYTYDANGNRASYLDNATPPVSLAYNVDTASNRLLGIGGSSAESFTYDATGNMLSYSAPFADYSFSYDARNRQTEAFVGAIGTSWLINGLGQRIGQTNGSVPEFFFVYDEAGHPTGKYDGGGNPLWETAWLGDLPVAVLEPAGKFYIAPDHLGAPHQITGASGAAVWQWNHDPFGNGAPLGAFTYELRFPGQFFDQSTKLHYNYFRDYDPRTGRYLESDPIGLAGGVNTYGYVGGDPLRFFDLLGLSWKDVETIINQFNITVSGLTNAGLRLNYPLLNNGLATLTSIFFKYSLNYLGCYQQSVGVWSALQAVQDNSLDDTWASTITGGGTNTGNGIILGYNEPGQGKGPAHWWITATSSNPTDPILILDPWRNFIYQLPPGATLPQNQTIVPITK